MSELQYAQTVAAEQEEMWAYTEWLIAKHPDCEVLRLHGQDDGSLIAYETGYLWEEFMEWWRK